MDAPFDSSRDSGNSGNNLSDYSTWSGAELAQAESAAQQFLSEHHTAIWESFARQGTVLARLFAMLKAADLTLEQRLDCFARIAEVSQGLQDSANGFFELGSQPVVARTLAEAKI